LRLLASIFLSDIVPVFVIAGVGFLLARYRGVRVQDLSRVVFNALSPCLVFTLLVTSHVDAAEFGRMALYAVLLMAAIGFVARLAAIPFGLDRPALVGFLLVAMFSNNGNYGLPVTLFAFGKDAMAQATVYFVTMAVLTYTVGILLAEMGRRSITRALSAILGVPAIYGVAAAALVVATHTALPVFVTRPVSLLADAAVPMMLLVLGMQLERAGMPDRPALVAVSVCLSLLGSPVLGFLIANALGLTGPARQAAVIQASMPAAVITTILAVEFDVAPNFVTAVVFFSTLLSPFTLTLLIAYLQRF
jgi:predicted permease